MIWCVIGICLITAMICVCFNCRIKKESNEFTASLDTEQLRQFENIKAERWNIFIKSTIASIITGLVVLYVYLNSDAPKMNTYAIGCLFMGVALFVQYFWYILTPKNKWMIEILDKQNQRSEWVDVYREYQKTFHLGLLIGAVGYYAIGVGMAQYVLS